MGFQDAIRTVLRTKYATFSGRASRSEFWWFAALYFSVLIVLGGALLAVEGVELGSGAGFSPLGLALSGLLAIFILATLIPYLAVTFRRLQDRNLSGWWYLAAVGLSLVPIIGMVGVIGTFVTSIMCFLPGTAGPNRYGSDPVGLSKSAVFN